MGFIGNDGLFFYYPDCSPRICIRRTLAAQIKEFGNLISSEIWRDDLTGVEEMGFLTSYYRLKTRQQESARKGKTVGKGLQAE